MANPIRWMSERRSARRMPEIKERLIDVAVEECGVASIADLGGCWMVDGRYLLHAVRNHPIERAVMIDTHPTEGFKTQAAEFSQVELIKGNFGSEAIAAELGEVDAVILFDVLLHQVRPDWDEVMRMYAERARVLIVFNQMWTAGAETIRLLDLGREEYLRNVPLSDFHSEVFDKLDAIHTVHQRAYRDVHNIWQWGIVRSDLERASEKLGFRSIFHEYAGRFGGVPNFDQHGWVFARG